MCGIFMTLTKNEYNNFNKNFYKIQKRGRDNSKVIKTNLNNKILNIGFHRLAINDTSSKGNQPFELDNVILICNGEIYNYKNLQKVYNIKMKSNSDCEIILQLYLKFKDFKKVIQLLYGVYSIVLIDKNINKIFITRDTYGVRSLYIGKNTFSNYQEFGISSQLNSLQDFNNVEQFPPNSIGIIENEFILLEKNIHLYKNLQLINYGNVKLFQSVIYHILNNAVRKRVKNLQEEQVACLLSGGLDSSIIACLLKKYFPNLKTFSVGFENSPDLIKAKQVADFLKTNHENVIISQEDAIKSIEKVIENIETYDTTTIRASTPMYMLCHYIKQNNPNIKVIFSGEGADEVFGGYKYLSTYTSPKELQKELLNLQENLYCFDNLRVDKCISSNNLEARLPFLDTNLVNFVNSINPELKMSNVLIEKKILRDTFNFYLPSFIINRKKEAFSDGISDDENSWYKIIQNYSDKLNEINLITDNFKINKPKNNEEKWFRSLFEKHFPGRGNINPIIWRQKINGFYNPNIDPSARSI